MRIIVTSQIGFQQPGVYRVQEIERERFFDLIEKAVKGENEVINKVLYLSSLKALNDKAGLEWPLYRGEVSLRSGDFVLSIVLSVDELPDFRYFQINYRDE